MSVLVLLGLIRLVPYVLVTYLAHSKGYRWLTALGVFVTINAIVNTFAAPSPQVRALLASISAFMLMMHALNIPPRERR